IRQWILKDKEKEEVTPQARSQTENDILLLKKIAKIPEAAACPITIGDDFSYIEFIQVPNGYFKVGSKEFRQNVLRLFYRVTNLIKYEF
ncbi:MAG TPA: hypothetical protein VIJ14_07875, partial [Rhabdochlamydiaceae bacterium]